jgi:hypothetical protein
VPIGALFFMEERKMSERNRVRVRNGDTILAPLRAPPVVADAFERFCVAQDRSKSSGLRVIVQNYLRETGYLKREHTDASARV